MEVGNGGERDRLPRAYRTLRAAIGDHGAATPFDSLYATYQPVLRRFAMRKFGIPRGDAEDLVHDVFATYLLRESEVRDPHAYLFGAIRHASQRYGERAAPLQQLPEHEPPSTREMADEVIRDVTFRATIARLGPACRETLYRFHVLGETASAIARSRDKKENYIFRLLNYCRNRARDIYRGLHPEDGS